MSVCVCARACVCARVRACPFQACPCRWGRGVPAAPSAAPAALPQPRCHWLWAAAVQAPAPAPPRAAAPPTGTPHTGPGQRRPSRPAAAPTSMAATAMPRPPRLRPMACSGTAVVRAMRASAAGCVCARAPGGSVAWPAAVLGRPLARRRRRVLRNKCEAGDVGVGQRGELQIPKHHSSERIKGLLPCQTQGMHAAAPRTWRPAF